MLLVDTSAWIEVLRRPSRLTLDEVDDDRDRIVTCLPVIQEVLRGFADEHAYGIARSAMYALPCLEAPLSHVVFDRAVDIYRRARRAGITVRSSGRLPDRGLRDRASSHCRALRSRLRRHCSRGIARTPRPRAATGSPAMSLFATCPPAPSAAAGHNEAIVPVASDHRPARVQRLTGIPWRGQPQ